VSRAEAMPPERAADGRTLLLRSLLWVPATRPERVAKAARVAPDAVAVDLEDAVGAGDKEEARRLAVAALAAGPRPAPVVLLRVNPVGSPWFDADVVAAADSAADGVVLPKVSEAGDLASLREALAARGRADLLVVAGLETAIGVADARSLLADADVAYFGAEDFVADMGGRRTAGGEEAALARSQVVLAARLAGIPALDQVVVTIDDDDRFLAEAAQAVALGYTGKMCIHPRQVALAHRAFTPTAEELDHARRVLAAPGSIGLVDGQMVDAVHLALARRVLARAGITEPGRPDALGEAPVGPEASQAFQALRRDHGSPSSVPERP